MRNLKNPAFLFVVLVATFTTAYLYTNLHSFDQSYLLLLSTSAIVNIILLGAYALQSKASKLKINTVLIVVVMVVASILKAFLERAAPGEQLDDSLFLLWKFDDAWAPIMKFVWHLSIDLFVLLLVAGSKKISETYKASQKTSVFLLPDVRNKLTPFSNLMALIEEYFKENEPQKKNQLEELIKNELPRCEKSLTYLSGNGTQKAE